MTTIKALETHYAGYRFRSRLEARYAVMWDTFGAKWAYESEGFDLGKTGRYLPDFWIKPFFVEIKGASATPLEIAKAKALANYAKTLVFIANGTPGGEHLIACSPEEKLYLPDGTAERTIIAFNSNGVTRLSSQINWWCILFHLCRPCCKPGQFCEPTHAAYAAARSARFGT